MTHHSKHPNPVAVSPHNQGRTFSVLAAAVIACLFVLLRQPSTHLPESYALCSSGPPAIYTVDDASPLVQCLVVHRGVIADTGSKKDIQRRWGDRDITGPIPGALSFASRNGLQFKYIPRGHIVVPGLADAHAHILEYGWSQNLDLSTTKSLEEVLHLIRSFILSHPDVLQDLSLRIEGSGWDQSIWPSSQFPTASDLEWDVLRGRPIVLMRKDGHAQWVSQRIIESLGDLPRIVEGGNIFRDNDGKPTGIFVDNAMGLITAQPWTDAAMAKYFAITAQKALAHGLTSIHDARATPRFIKFFKQLADRRQIPIRLYLMGSKDLDQVYWGGEIERLIDYGGGRLTVRAIKLFTDGKSPICCALGSSGAALLEPYADDPSNSGLMRLSEDVLQDLIAKFLQDGWQVNVHWFVPQISEDQLLMLCSIGDRANHVVLDIFELLLKDMDATAIRPRIEHAQIMTEEDLQRIGRLGVIASIQPTHATSDMHIAETRLGAERVKGAYAYRTLAEHGRIAIGSDAPVESLNPILGFYAAVSRLDTKGDSPHGRQGWLSQQRLTRAQALKGMTLDAAYASFSEDRLGSLTRGKLADFVVLDRDIMDENSDPANILATSVIATVIDGQLLYGRI